VREFRKRSIRGSLKGVRIRAIQRFVSLLGEAGFVAVADGVLIHVHLLKGVAFPRRAFQCWCRTYAPAGICSIARCAHFSCPTESAVLDPASCAGRTNDQRTKQKGGAKGPIAANWEDGSVPDSSYGVRLEHKAWRHGKMDSPCPNRGGPNGRGVFGR